MALSQPIGWHADSHHLWEDYRAPGYFTPPMASVFLTHSRLDKKKSLIPCVSVLWDVWRNHRNELTSWSQSSKKWIGKISVTNCSSQARVWRKVGSVASSS